ncbi:1,4-alpha-glucan branching protein domain-containing protein [Paenibacillus xanthanilyticus]|uniref:1,4-alpha-glucan branching protein domain-containing protein n=1 Tax=Paenibacillus xanthanilyticus TaxID=1783531 RepID=A0ABV8KBD0_9BACL
MMNKIRPKPVCKGYITLVLHMHLPYIRHHDRDDYLEERWFYEAMLETYLPLLEMMERLDGDGVDFRMTLSMTPTLLALLEDPLMQQRFLAHLDKLIRLAESETKRLKDDPALLPLAHMYKERFEHYKAMYLAGGMALIPRFKALQDAGKIEIMTSAATHAFLPLVKTEEAIKAQIATAVNDYVRHFGQRPQGIWLPECAYSVGIDRILRQYGIHYFLCDSTAVQYATPRANRELYAPLLTPYGVTAFPRDPASAQQVWSSTDGYPGDFDYREYYRDIGWDLGWESEEAWRYIKPYVLPTNERVNTGIKYYRITSKGSYKEPYNPEWARGKAAMQADHFIACRQAEAEHAFGFLDRTPLMLSPYDAELFGHWWYEGPIWLEELCRKLYYDQHTIRMITPSEYLAQYPLADTGKINDSSWGRHSSSEVWLQGHNDWIYRHLHQAEERMIRVAGAHAELAGAGENALRALTRRALNQAARELMLAQSSDWAFIMDAGTVVEYAVNRTKRHLLDFHRLCDMLDHESLDPEWIATLEERDNCFPLVSFADYVPIDVPSPVALLSASRLDRVMERTRNKRNTFMLAWEYPPKNVGGLSKAVSELAQELARRGEAVHVVTTSQFGAPYFEEKDGVFVHRVPVLHSGDTDFYHWMFEMNLAMTDHLVQWIEAGGRVDLLHAHDWMVYYTAREIKMSYRIPLVATIHATEWGRNGGALHTELQHNIHRLEAGLCYEAAKVIVCSTPMVEEVRRCFQLSEEKIALVPNGIDVHVEEAAQPKQEEGRVIFFIGRLVFEKGVQVLLHAAPQILHHVPDARIVIAGSGPMEHALRQQAANLGDRVRFVGFVSDQEKSAWMARADVVVIPSLYEPFGLVALEAMRYRRPLVVSDTGGLASIVEHGVHGFKALPGHVDSLAWHVTESLMNPGQAESMAENAYEKLVTEYQWERLAQRVSGIYGDAVDRQFAANAQS